MSKSKAKGTAFESAQVNYKREHGFPLAERRILGGVNDKGDLAGVPGWVEEYKNCKSYDLAGWMAEAEREAANAGVDRYAVVFKRRGVGDPGKQFALIPYWLLCELQLA